MAGGVQVELLGSDGGSDAVIVPGEAGAGDERIDESKNFGAFYEGCGVAADLAGEGDEDAVDFCLFFFDEADELVVLLDGFERFDVDSLPGGTDPVNDTGDAALEFAADGDDEAVAADGDEVFLR